MRKKKQPKDPKFDPAELRHTCRMCKYGIRSVGHAAPGYQIDHSAAQLLLFKILESKRRTFRPPTIV